MAYSNPIATKDYKLLLRKEATACERILWHYLKNRQIEGLKFRQQHGFGPYVMDFYCPLLRWCIEVDGGIHGTPEQMEKDRDRTAFLNRHRIEVTRVTNEEIENDTQAVVRLIRQQALQLAAERHLTLPVQRHTKTSRREP